jgi:hypothetical protein
MCLTRCSQHTSWEDILKISNSVNIVLSCPPREGFTLIVHQSVCSVGNSFRFSVIQYSNVMLRLLMNSGCLKELYDMNTIWTKIWWPAIMSFLHVWKLPTSSPILSHQNFERYMHTPDQSIATVWSFYLRQSRRRYRKLHTDSRTQGRAGPHDSRL